jgi:hypothetical protein
MFLVMILLPVSILVGTALAVFATRRALQRGAGSAAALSRGLASVALLFTVCFIAELWRTRLDRRPEAEPPGTLAEYFRKYPW